MTTPPLVSTSSTSNPSKYRAFSIRSTSAASSGEYGFPPVARANSRCATRPPRRHVACRHDARSPLTISSSAGTILSTRRSRTGLRYVTSTRGESIGARGTRPKSRSPKTRICVRGRLSSTRPR
ncbi:hypothetical protein AMAG_17849 [Allomyces macrogynus ATCC 38327]|uniref:Uncharacterized protein n=1 Tax=Allomyces macrogynus (strain ATCC 38327) TaxID=578462 RepID=A0A0L0S0U4_ALLM3|nr:hypothetical protein AMAG_17849 [Allomyces macrogynus ATCC 38327]|eukprot:KNE55954.1 hypothetical protein AMAG_17849 [Allomyces macrogynus ATCC 38327]